MAEKEARISLSRAELGGALAAVNAVIQSNPNPGTPPALASLESKLLAALKENSQ